MSEPELPDNKSLASPPFSMSSPILLLANPAPNKNIGETIVIDAARLRPDHAAFAVIANAAFVAGMPLIPSSSKSPNTT